VRYYCAECNCELQQCGRCLALIHVDSHHECKDVKRAGYMYACPKALVLIDVPEVSVG
jgi:hypothetical protein